jgi:hypothetical protein
MRGADLMRPAPVLAVDCVRHGALARDWDWVGAAAMVKALVAGGYIPHRQDGMALCINVPGSGNGPKCHSLKHLFSIQTF